MKGRTVEEAITVPKSETFELENGGSIKIDRCSGMLMHLDIYDHFDPDDYPQHSDPEVAKFCHEIGAGRTVLTPNVKEVRKIIKVLQSFVDNIDKYPDLNKTEYYKNISRAANYKRDKLGHLWIERGASICPYICKDCGALSGSNESILQCRKTK
jgi:hypothetical protein